VESLLPVKVIGKWSLCLYLDPRVCLIFPLCPVEQGAL